MPQRRILPWLNEKHTAARKQWASDLLDEEFTAWVDVDEAWFYTVSLHHRVKIPPGAEVPTLFCKSKTQVPKVMFLAAACRPRPGGRSGKLGIWRVKEEKTARYNSKKHEAGDTYDVNGTLTAEKYFKMMTENVFPAIQKAFAGTAVKRVIVQQDGARPHTGKGNMNKLKDGTGEKLNAVGSQLPIPIEVRTQPAQSPDFNICDLALFRALKVAVRHARRDLSAGRFDVDLLVKDVMSTYKNYSDETLEKMWQYKQYVMQQVAKDGSNTYERHHK